MALVDYLIVGGGCAGATAASTLRAQGAKGRVVLVSEEPYYPYMRFKLSREYFLGEGSTAEMLMHPPSYYSKNGIEVKLGGRAVALDSQTRIVTLQSGEELHFERLLVATGASPRALPIPGADRHGTYYLRDLTDAEKVRKEISPRRKVVIIGGGFTGAEVAATFVEKGLQVTVTDVLNTIWEHAFGVEVGSFFQSRLEEAGVRVLTPVHVEAVEGDDDGTVRRVVTREGYTLECDFVLVSVGAVPRTALAESGGLAVDNGILVDEYLQSSVEGIFAAGDTARVYSPPCHARTRMEHWPIAARQGMVAARNMLGAQEPYDQVPRMFSDLFHHRLDYVGCPGRRDRLVMRRYAKERFISFYVLGSEVRGAALVNDSAELALCRELVKDQERPHDLGALSNPDVPLADCLS